MTLSGLTIGSLELTPAFDADVTEYTATTTNATNKVTATAHDEHSTVEILVNDEEIESGDSAEWEEGENEVAITVRDGLHTETYTVTVTKTTEPED